MARSASVPDNLPHELSSFVGRERERAEVARLLGTTRLLTLAGAGGAGKTRLALRVAADVRADFPDGVWLAELAWLGDPALVPAAVGLAVGVREQPGRPPVETLAQALGRGGVLVVLDNCEHLVDACARLVDRLLRACPRLRVLATSRERLGVPGELTWRVPPLSTPAERPDLSAAELAGADAVRLFVARASAVLPGFVLSDANAAAIAQICRRLDGMPLAIELAAVRTRTLSPGEIAARLDDRFRLLVGGSRTAPPRQQTLRATVGWSYDLLAADEQRLFERLAPFAGGFDLAAAARVGLDEPAQADGDDALGRLDRLVDQSLVLVDRLEADAPARYSLLETLRAFAWER